MTLNRGLSGPDVQQPVAKENKPEQEYVLIKITARMEMKLLKMADKLRRRKIVRVILPVLAKSKRSNANFRQKLTFLLNAKMMLPSALAMEMKCVNYNVKLTSEILMICISVKPRCPILTQSMNICTNPG